MQIQSHGLDGEVGQMNLEGTGRRKQASAAAWIKDVAGCLNGNRSISKHQQRGQFSLTTEETPTRAMLGKRTSAGKTLKHPEACMLSLQKSSTTNIRCGLCWPKEERQPQGTGCDTTPLWVWKIVARAVHAASLVLLQIGNHAWAPPLRWALPPTLM